MMLIWADSEDSKASKRGKVLEVRNESPNIKSYLNDQIFCICVRVDGGEKELVFQCIDRESKNFWVNACKYGLAQIEQE